MVTRQMSNRRSRGATMRGALLVLIAALTVPLPRLAHSQIPLRVQAQSRLSVQTAFADGQVRVEGVLTDELGVPLAGRAIDVVIGDGLASGRTDARGRFDVVMPMAATTAPLKARFAGDAHQQPVELRRTIDASKAPVTVRLAIASPRLDLDVAFQDVLVRVSSPGHAGGLRIALYDERQRPITTGVTDPSGELRWRLASVTLGPPGTGRLVAVTDGDATRDAGQVELDVVRFVATRLTMTVEASSADTVRAQGRLETRSGALAGRAVSIHLDDALVAHATTDAQGRFTREVTLRGESSATLEARYVPEVEWLGASRSGPVTLGGRAPSAPSLAWLLLPLVACLPALRSLLLRDDRPPGVGAAPPPPGRTAGGLLSSPRLGRPTLTALGGRVLDAQTERPVEGACVTLRTPDGRATQWLTDADGRFACPAGASGHLGLHVSAEGFLPAEHPVRLPHRGELLNLELRLVGVRAHLLTRLHEVAQPFVHPSTDCARLTPREVAGEASRRDPPHEALVRMAARVELGAYGRTVPDQPELAAIEAEARRVLDSAASPTVPARGTPSRND